MSGNLFKRALFFTDLHVGLKSNSLLHLEDCWEYANWIVSLAKKENCETCFFLGDFHNNRANINILTLSYSLKILELLSKNFSQIFFIPGNHDLYFREKRDVHSVDWARHLPNVRIINDFFVEGDVGIIPWLVGDEHKKIEKIHAKYMLGHLELPHFYMNAMVAMPDHNTVQQEHFKGADSVFSGHFHKRQCSNNINYIGNCFPHNYSDAGDDARGCMTLEWGAKPVYHTWLHQPTYRVYNLSEILTSTDTLLKPKMHIRANIDIDLSYEEAAFIKDTFVEKYNLRELTLMPAKSTDLSEYEARGSVTFESVDSIVTSQLTTIASEHFDPKVLLEIYRQL